MAGTYNHPMANQGRMDDRMMAHVAPGEQIVPKPVLDANPEEILKTAFHSGAVMVANAYAKFIVPALLINILIEA